MRKHILYYGLVLFGLFLSVSAISDESKLTSENLHGLKLRSIGPALMSGRIADIAIHPSRQSIWYVAVGSGGVWKTENAGTTWKPIFDDQGSYSIACVTLDPNHPDVVWVGTGENISGRHVGYGNGIYKSVNGGQTWNHMGLTKSEHIAKILIDPDNSDVVYAAAEGPLWSEGGERGVYKSTDSGKTWKPVLTISKDTGVTDLAIDPDDPNVLYAAAYQRRRHIWLFMAGGSESGIYKTTDAGTHWRKLTNGLPNDDMGKIGLAVSPINSKYVYATIEAQEEVCGFYRSVNGGEYWEKRNNYISGGTGPHYYQEIMASPHKLDRVYQMDVWTHITEDGGLSFRKMDDPRKHADNHALAFDPGNPDYLLAGTDGGLYESWDHGESWKYIANLPVTQFYKMALDNDVPFYNVIGGTQDNNTQYGPSRTTNVHGIRNEDWHCTVNADGYACQIDPENPNIIYSEWQNGGLIRYDRQSGERIIIKPQPAEDDPPERWNWDAPMLISPHSPIRLYFGSQRLWKSDDRGDSWIPISTDLSRGENRYNKAIMDRVWGVDALYGNTSMSRYGNLTIISESPLQEGLIYIGTDDGVIQVTENGGKSWRKIDQFQYAPDLVFVNDIKSSLHDVNTLYAAFDNHKTGDFTPYILKSTDRGRSWISISGDLPDRHIVWAIAQDHEIPEILFAGTEFGLFFTLDGGSHWIELTGGVPTIAFRDIEIQRRENDLVGATFGRGFYILDDYSVLRQIKDDTFEQKVVLFSVRDALLYEPSAPLGLPGKAFMGGSYYTAPNPPYGAVMTYYLKESLRTSKEARIEREKKKNRAGKDVDFPGYEVLETEEYEYNPVLILTVKDDLDHVVRRIPGPITAGFHRVAWDLRYPANTPVNIDPLSPKAPWDTEPVGPYALPGKYSITLTIIQNGNAIFQTPARIFHVIPHDNGTLKTMDREEALVFQKKTGALQRDVWGTVELVEESMNRLQYIKEAIKITPKCNMDLLVKAQAMEAEFKEMKKRLTGDPVRRRLRESALPSILSRVEFIIEGHWRSTYGPTHTHQESYEIAYQAFEDVKAEIRNLIENDLKPLEKDLEDAGAPWTPGREVF